ncbi:MAG: Hpt domain-containing protein [Sterolibacteriaceae bacterium]|uniref:Hpt domain-containing protein n=1 Tax=Sulfuritalea sp. TaxID=2480090 RepID=UPI001A471801|nr:Hpt domain-containing protein [Sulfuritalea sp.]MBL8478728.1 Hpt domain-containing protein [Sterolibacteriaceae bacterium]MBN8476736.1 Hpt domain-containing protein [Sulfuritalea sp.]
MHATPKDIRDPQAGPAPIDRKVLDQYREIDPSGGPGLAHRIVRIYIDSAAETLRQIEQAIAGRDPEALRQATHSLKSSTASIGAMSLADLFRELEAMAKAARIDDAAVVFDEARNEYERVLVALRDLLAEAP